MPWVLLSAGVDYDLYERQVRVACDNGASGILCGRAVWKESVDYAGGQAHRLHPKHLHQALPPPWPHMVEHNARPWTDFLPGG